MANRTLLAVASAGCLSPLLAVIVVGVCIIFAPFILAIALLGFTCMVIASMFKE